GAPFGVLPSGRKRPSASATCVLSRLNSAAHTLLVYASQRGLLPNHATLGSGWLSPLPGRVEYLLGSTKRFQLHGSILLLQASPGAPSAFAEPAALRGDGSLLHVGGHLIRHPPLLQAPVSRVWVVDDDGFAEHGLRH